MQGSLVALMRASNTLIVPATEAETVAGETAGKAVTPVGLTAALPFYDVRRFGAVGNGVADDTIAIQSAIAAADAAGGGVVFLPAGDYLISTSLVMASFVALVGVGCAYRGIEYGIDPPSVASTIYHAANSFTMLYAASATGFGTTSIEVRGIRFDQTGETGDGAIIHFNQTRRSLIRDCYLKGEGTTSRIGFLHTHAAEHNRIETSTLEGCGIINQDWGNRLTVDGVEIGAGGIKITDGFDHQILDCDIYNDAIAVGASFPQYPNGVELRNINGCLVRGNQITSSQQHGILCSAGIERSLIIGNHLENNSRESAGVWSGIALDSNSPGMPTENNVVANNVCYDSSGASGTQAYGVHIQSTSGTQTNDNLIVGNVLTGNRVGAAQQDADLANMWRDNTGTVSQTVASAATITVPPGAELVPVTGTTTITSVTAGYPGQRVILSFDDVLTFTDGSNLKLASNFVTSADDTISLVCDGVNWREVGRSAN